MSTKRRKSEKFVDQVNVAPLERARHKLKLYSGTLTISGILIPLVLAILIAAFPSWFTHVQWWYILILFFVLLVWFVIIQLKVSYYQTVSEELLEKEIRSSEEARTIDVLVDQYTAILDAVSDEIYGNHTIKETYGVLNQHMVDMVHLRIPTTNAIAVNFYRRCDNAGQLIWNNRVVGRKITPVELIDHEIKKGEDTSYLQKYLFSSGDEVYPIGNSKIPEEIRNGNKFMKFYLGRRKSFNDNGECVSYYVELVGYDGSQKLSDDLRANIVCDIIDPVIDIFRLVDRCYGGADYAEKNTNKKKDNS